MEPDSKPSLLERISNWLMREPEDREQLIELLHGAYENNLMDADALGVLNELELPLARELEPETGELQRLSPMIEALYVPNIDEALDEETAKREFWSAFRVLGQWWADLPPY